MQTQPFPAEFWFRMHNPNRTLNHEDSLDILALATITHLV